MKPDAPTKTVGDKDIRGGSTNNRAHGGKV